MLKERVANIEPLVEAQLQIIIQSVILYTITFENAIDMSSLLYSDTTSKVTYFLLLLSSILSTCISFTKMLQAGDLPVLSSVFSIRAVIVFVFIVTKFLLLAYLNSLAMTSIILGTIAFAGRENDPAYTELFDNFYRGLCRPSKNPSAFCADNPPITLFTATRTLPILSFVGIYLCPLLYLVTLNIKSRRSFTYETLIHLIFPLATNLSFYGDIDIPQEGARKTVRAKKRRNVSMPCIHPLDIIKTPRWGETATSGTEKNVFRQNSNPESNRARTVIVRVSSLDIDITTFPRDHIEHSKTTSVPNRKFKPRRFSLPPNLESFVSREDPKKAEEFQFSLKQSAVLYTMFLVNALTAGLLDMVIQIVNIRYSQCKRPGQCEVANIEQMSVLESLMEVDPISKAYMGILFSNILAFVFFAVSLRKRRGGTSFESAQCQLLRELAQEW